MQRSFAFPAALLLVCLLIAPACGGGGSGGGAGGGGGFELIHFLHIGSVDSRDGHVRSDGDVQTHWLYGTSGDDDLNRARRVFLSFPLDGVPEGAIVTGATLVIQGDPSGDPVSLGVPIVEHVDIGPSLNAIDYGLAPRSPAPMDPKPTISWINVHYDVLDAVLMDLADGRTYIDFRHRFTLSSNLNGAYDGGMLYTAGPGNVEGRCHLVIAYKFP